MISAAIFDLDGTLTRTASPWQYIHERLGLWHNVACGHLEEWLSGHICYEEFCRLDTSLWKGCSVRQIEAFLDEIPFNKHLDAVVGRLVAARIPSAIISSGFQYLAMKIQEQWDWHPLLIYANELVDGPEVCIRVSGDVGSPKSKRAIAGQALRHFNATVDRTLVVSDSVRDLELLRECKYKLLVESEDDLLRVTDFLD
jgi:phosphoserine phosphatase